MKNHERRGRVSEGDKGVFISFFHEKTDSNDGASEIERSSSYIVVRKPARNGRADPLPTDETGIKHFKNDIDIVQGSGNMMITIDTTND